MINLIANYNYSENEVKTRNTQKNLLIIGNIIKKYRNHQNIENRVFLQKEF